MIRSRTFVAAILLLCAALFGPGPGLAQTQPQAAGITFSVQLDGKLKHPQTLSLEALRKLPAEQAQVSYQGEKGTTTTSFSGPRLWAVLEAAGGLDDSEKGAELRHVIKVIGRDGYVVVLSTGEIAPEFGAKPALLAYQRDGQPDTGLRLVMPGDKRGGRNVRDVVSIRVE